MGFIRNLLEGTCLVFLSCEIVCIVLRWTNYTIVAVWRQDLMLYTFYLSNLTTICLAVCRYARHGS